MKSSCCFSVKYIALVNTFSLNMRIFLIFSLNLFDNQFFFFLFKQIRLFYFSFSLLSKLFSTCFAHNIFLQPMYTVFSCVLIPFQQIAKLKTPNIFLCLFSFHYINGSAITRLFLSFLCLYLIILLIV